VATKDRDRAGGSTSDPGDHGELNPGVGEFGDRHSGLSVGNCGEFVEDPLSRLLAGDRAVIAVVESSQFVQVRLHVRHGEAGDQGIDGRLVGRRRDWELCDVRSAVHCTVDRIV